MCRFSSSVAWLGNINKVSWPSPNTLNGHDLTITSPSNSHFIHTCIDTYTHDLSQLANRSHLPSVTLKPWTLFCFVWSFRSVRRQRYVQWWCLLVLVDWRFIHSLRLHQERPTTDRDEGSQYGVWPPARHRPPHLSGAFQGSQCGQISHHIWSKTGSYWLVRSISGPSWSCPAWGSDCTRPPCQLGKHQQEWWVDRHRKLFIPGTDREEERASIFVEALLGHEPAFEQYGRDPHGVADPGSEQESSMSSMERDCFGAGFTDTVRQCQFVAHQVATYVGWAARRLHPQWSAKWPHHYNLRIQTFPMSLKLWWLMMVDDYWLMVNGG